MSARSPGRFFTITLDREEMRARGRIGAHVAHSRHGGRLLTSRAREVFLAQFEEQVDPDGTLSPEEREHRAAHARKAYFARLALASARARRKAQQPEPVEPPLIPGVSH